MNLCVIYRRINMIDKYDAMIAYIQEKCSENVYVLEMLADVKCVPMRLSTLSMLMCFVL